MPIIDIPIHGTPAPVGSKKAFCVRGAGGKSRAVITDDNKRSRPWMSMVADAAVQAWPDAPLLAPVSVSIEFEMPRPRSHYRTGKNAHLLRDDSPYVHSQTPDIDKLVRCIIDGLSGIVFGDDRQVYEVRARKSWATEKPKARVQVQTLMKAKPE